MTMRWMYDASTPPADPPHWHVAAGYIGGDTPHVWTREEWDAQWSPFLLPIFTASNRPDDAASAEADAAEMYAALRGLGVPRGATVVVDTETKVYVTYIKMLDGHLRDAGYPLMNYGSLSALRKNPLTYGGRWAGDWTDQIMQGVDLAGQDGIRAVQWASSGMLGKPWDASVIEQSVPLWHRAYVG